MKIVGPPLFPNCPHHHPNYPPLVGTVGEKRTAYFFLYISFCFMIFYNRVSDLDSLDNRLQPNYNCCLEIVNRGP